MTAIKNNVVQFNTQGDKNVWTCIRTFLDRIGQNSQNTKDNYERAIRDFFRAMRNKELEDLVESDLVFTKPQVETYQVGLRNHFKATTVNNKLSALKKCYEKLEDYGFEVSANWFKLDRYKEYDKESYDTLSHDEVCAIIHLVSETRKGFEKALLVRLAYATAFRRESLLDLKWTDIINRDGQWFVKTLGKGNKWDYKKISNELYDELMKQKDLIGGDKIFQLTKKTVNKMMDYIRSNMDFGDRNIVFHSFKKASINEVNVITGGDIKAMQRQGNHASATTTLNDYLANKELDDLVVVDTNKHIPVEKFDELSHEELLSLIKGMDRNIQIKLLQKMGAM
jgi:integrase